MGATSTFLHERIDEILRTNKAGDKQFGLRDQYKKLSKKFGEPVAKGWLKEHMRVTLWCRTMFELKNWGMADTETTNTDDNAQVVELSIVKVNGDILYDSLLKPTCDISPAASAIHGIYWDDVRDKKTFAEDSSEIQDAFDSLSMVMFYNGEFDKRLMAQTAFHQESEPIVLPSMVDPLLSCASWIGDWNARRSGFKWPKLEGGHRGKDDCISGILALKRMSTSNLYYCKKLIAGTET